jgi:hypothetical protein
MPLLKLQLAETKNGLGAHLSQYYINEFNELIRQHLPQQKQKPS